MIYELKNANGLHMKVTNFGCRIMDLWVPDRYGLFSDIVLGTYDEGKYIDYGKGERFLGATIGRFGNRIAKGRFTLEGKTYILARNNGENALHGGVNGFDMTFWKVERVTESRIDFCYLSRDGEEGYPGNLKVNMSYELTSENELAVNYLAETDAPTVLNLTHHSFFNLHGEGEGNVNDLVMMINAGYYTPVDETLIPTGEVLPVDGTPFDFRQPSSIASKLDFNNEQIRIGGGFDHNWVLDRSGEGTLELAARVYDKSSGRVIEVLTTEPGLQFYGGNYFDGSMRGKNGKPYTKHCSFALEAQHFPDSPNKPGFPTTVLLPGEKYVQKTVYRFSILLEEDNTPHKKL